MSAGYGGSVLAHDKNLAAGLPVRDALFVTVGGRAKFKADPAPAVVNSGSEKHSGGQLEGFAVTRPLGDMISVHRAVLEEGNDSVRVENFSTNPGDWAGQSKEGGVRPD